MKGEFFLRLPAKNSAFRGGETRARGAAKKQWKKRILGKAKKKFQLL